MSDLTGVVTTNQLLEEIGRLHVTISQLRLVVGAQQERIKKMQEELEKQEEGDGDDSAVSSGLS